MKNKAVIIAFFVMLALSVSLLLLPADIESVRSENREPQKMPSLNADTIFSGKFAEEFEGFLGDNTAFRAPVTKLARILEEKKGLTLKKGRIIATNKDIGTGTTQKQTLLLANNAIMEMFIRNSAQEREYTEAVNMYAEKLPQNIEMYSMLIPTQLEFCEPIYKNLQDSQFDAINAIYEGLNPRVKVIDAYSALREHTDEYIYFRTDHHWTPLGAYYGYREFMNVSGGAASDKDNYEVNKINNMLGYLYDRVPQTDSDITPDTINWYEVDPDNKIKTVMHDVGANGEITDYKGVMYDRTKANYLFFFGSDHPIVDMVNTENPNGKTIAVMKDSYTNVLAPWLIKSYHRVILIDPRIYTGTIDTIIDEFNPDDFLFVNYIFTTVFKDYTDLMKGIVK